MRKRFIYFGMFDFIYLYLWVIFCRLIVWNRGYISFDWLVLIVDFFILYYFK